MNRLKSLRLHRDPPRNLRAGFALIELPLVLLILAVIGLVAVGSFHYFSRDVPWYAWFVGPLAPVVMLLGFAAISAWIERR